GAAAGAAAALRDSLMVMKPLSLVLLIAIASACGSPVALSAAALLPAGRRHVQRPQILVAAFDRLHVLAAPDVVDAQPAAVAPALVSVRALLEVGAHHRVGEELDKLAGPGDLPVELALPALQPRQKREGQELTALMLDVAERRPAQLAEHVRRHAEPPRHLLHAELPRAEELRILRGNGQRLPSHPLLEDQRLTRVAAAGVPLLPLVAQPLEDLRIELLGMREDTARAAALRQERCREAIRRDAGGEALPRGAHDAHADDPIE